MTLYNDSDAKRMRRTARDASFAANAVVPRLARTMIRPGYQVLDYGAGKAGHADLIAERTGAKVTTVDLDDNGVTEDYVLGLYDVVYASNVLNVQADQDQIMDVLLDLDYAARPGGVVIFNFPPSPRHNGANKRMVERMACNVFERVTEWQPNVFVATATNPAV